MGESKQIWLPLPRSPCLSLLAPLLAPCGGEEPNTKPSAPLDESSDSYQIHLDSIGM